MKDYILTEENINGTICYYAEFEDGSGNIQKIETSKEVYDVIDISQHRVASQGRAERRYGVCSYNDSVAEDEIINDTEQTEEMIKKVWEYFEDLTDVQKRRLTLYYVKGKPFQEIAEIEGASYSSIRESVVSAVKILKNKKYF